LLLLFIFNKTKEILSSIVPLSNDMTFAELQVKFNIFILYNLIV